MAEADLQLKSYVQITLQNLAEKNPFDFLTNFTQRIDKFQTRLGAVSVASLIMKAGQQINNDQASVLDGLSVDAVVASAIQSVKGVVASKTTWLSTYNQTLLTTLEAYTSPSGSGASTLSVASLLVFLPLIVLTPASC